MGNNAQLQSNRYYMSSRIDIVHFLAANELPLRGSDDFNALESELENSDGEQHSRGLFSEAASSQCAKMRHYEMHSEQSTGV